MKIKWKIISVLSFITIFLFVTGAAPLIFSEVVYGCNLQRTFASDDIGQVSDHPITKAYYEKYELDSTSTSRSRSLEWGYGTVEYSSSSPYVSYYDVWPSAHLKIVVDQCGMPQKFEFQCRDNQRQVLVSLNSKNDNLLEYLETENCFDVLGKR